MPDGSNELGGGELAALADFKRVEPEDNLLFGDTCLQQFRSNSLLGIVRQNSNLAVTNLQVC